MDFMEIIRKIRDGIAAFRNGDIVTAARIGFELALTFLDGLVPKPMFGSTESAAAVAAVENKSMYAIADDMEAACKQFETKARGATAEAVDLNPIVVMLWPLLKVWLAKLLERL